MMANTQRGWPAMGEGRGAEVARRLHHRDSLAATPRLDDVDASLTHVVDERLVKAIA